ncbi:hypothetical protein EBQ10_03510 [Trueperella pyogenes]|uniref:Uncharacterized protein n=1 Tax=Trueperella pyogenes TaxID=1661 RepID=A0A3Q9GH71_9ACTO|nr:hypothetical protein EBQ10_03510 [Trueperella pyogenes]
MAEIRRLERLVAQRDEDLARLRAENAWHVAEHARQLSEFEAEREAWQEKDASWRRAVEGLGKAIEIMESHGAS